MDNETIAKRVAELPSGRRDQVNSWVEDQDAIINLAAGDPDVATPKVFINAMHEALDDGFTGYTDFYGLSSLRRLIADQLEQKLGTIYEPAEEIIVVSGVQEGIYASVQTLLDQNEQALIPSPHYATYYNSVIAAEGKPTLVELKEDDDYLLSAEEIEDNLTARSKLLLFSNPNNPLGVVWPEQCLEDVASVARQNDLYVLSDEIYEDFAEGSSPRSIATFPGMKQRTVIANGFSKIYSVTGLRIGYLAGPSEIIKQIKKLHYNIALCSNSISQKAAIAALSSNHAKIDTTIFSDRRSFLWESLKKLRGVHCVKPEGGLYAFPNISSFGLSDTEFAKHLAKNYGVLTLPGTEFGKYGRGHIRLSLCTSVEKIRLGMEKMQKAIREDF